MMISIAWVGVLPLLLIVLFLVAMVVRARQGDGRSRFLVYRPRRHGLATRIILTVLGLAAFAGVGFSTWQEIHSRYGRIPELSTPEAGPVVVEPRSVKVPAATLEPPLPDAGITGSNWVRRDIKKPDIYAYLVVAQEVGGIMVTQQIEPMGNLAQFFGGGQTICDFRILGRPCEVRVNPLAAWWEAHGERSTTPTLNLHASITGRMFLNSSWERPISYSGFDFPFVPICRFMTPPLHTRMISLERPIPDKFQLWLVGIAAAPGSGEKEISASEFVRTYGSGLYERNPALIGPQYTDPYQRVSVNVPGLAMLVTKGVAAVALLMAALLLAELFRRRLVAAAVLTVLVVLYVAAWDRYALGIHLSHMQDKSAPLALRMKACENVQTTYFYRKTAGTRLDQLAHDSAAPGQLQSAAAHSLAWLQP